MHAMDGTVSALDGCPQFSAMSLKSSQSIHTQKNYPAAGYCKKNQTM
jgi:hypothetical protein